MPPLLCCAPQPNKPAGCGGGSGAGTLKAGKGGKLGSGVPVGNPDLIPLGPAPVLTGCTGSDSTVGARGTALRPNWVEVTWALGCAEAPATNRSANLLLLRTSSCSSFRLCSSMCLRSWTTWSNSTGPSTGGSGRAPGGGYGTTGSDGPATVASSTSAVSSAVTRTRGRGWETNTGWGNGGLTGLVGSGISVVPPIQIRDLGPLLIYSKVVATERGAELPGGCPAAIGSSAPFRASEN